MVFQSPPNLVVLVAFSVTALLSVIAVGLTGALCNEASWDFCAVQGTVAAGPAIGIVAGVFGGVFTGLGISWLLLTPLWTFQPMKYVFLSGFSFVTLFAFISGVILAWTASNEWVGNSLGTCGAGAAFEFFLMLLAASCIFLVVRVSGGLFPTPSSSTSSSSTSSSSTSVTSANVPSP